MSRFPIKKIRLDGSIFMDFFSKMWYACKNFISPYEVAAR